MIQEIEARASRRTRTPVSNRRYVTARGLLCPFCSAADIEGTDGVEIDAGVATQHVGCNNCDGRWTDVYRLVGYRALPDQAMA